MTFPSLTFGIFFAIILALHRSPLSWTTRKGILLVGSYLFYAVWNPPFVALLWVSTAVDWFLARRIHSEEKQGTRRLYLAASLATNLGLLAFFKYGGFAVETLTDLARLADIELELAAPSIVLPVGISFYTFQTLSYSIDVYRRQRAPATSLLDYALYVTFFPQLVAGPIVRSETFLPQAETERRPDAQQTSWGLTLLVLGLFQKSVLADALLAPVVEKAYALGAPLSTLDAWTGTVAFAGQIFCDFSGYSTCAIGVALTLGFHLPDNFRAPYAAVGFSDFWRRWHISLSTWLRDYLYIPLGGSRHGAARTALALGLTMLLGGLWHGASWTFVVWGALHGLYLVVERGLRRLFPHAPPSTGARRLALTSLTFALVCVAWVFFRAESFPQAFHIVGVMLTGGGAPTHELAGWHRVVVVVVIAGVLLSHQALRVVPLEERVERLPTAIRAAWIAIMLFAIVVSPGSQNDFIYFQF